MAAIDVLDPAARRLLLDLLTLVAGIADETDEERDALAGAALALGLDPGALPAHALSEVPLSGLDARDRMLFYAAAVWMTLADGVRIRAESELLTLLQARLGVGDASARFLERHARWVRTSTGDLPAHREIDLLLTEGARRIAAVEARRAA